MPSSYRNLEAIYEVFEGNELESIISLSPEEKELLGRYTPRIYVCYVHSATFFSAYHESIQIHGNCRIMKPGIQISANNMPQGEILQIPLKRNIGRQNQVHFVAHFNNCKPDLGRKGFQKEVVEFCEEVAKKLIEGPFQKYRHVLKPATGEKTDLKREQSIEEWKLEMQEHEKSSPLILENENFFLPVKKIAITSMPTREQDVIALFNQLVSGGVIRGLKIMSTNERFTYDGMYKVSFTPPSANHVYHKETNPLGVLADNLQSDGFISGPKILEYKYSLDGLIEDLETGEKVIKDLGLAVVWETGVEYRQHYHILSLLDPDNLAERQYHGITHVVQNYQTSAREMDLIVLSELVAYLNNPEQVIPIQKGKYDS
jgi:hypothetical protein